MKQIGRLFLIGCLTLWCDVTLGASNDNQTLRIQVPAEARAFPEPLAAGQQPGFKIRGIKGWAWTPAQYLQEIPWLVKFKMNFLMGCYTSLFLTDRHPWQNQWYKPLPPDKKLGYAKVIAACRGNGITFCFCMNPQLYSDRPLNANEPKDIDTLYQHYAWAQSLGVKYFSICLDDVNRGSKAAADVAGEDALLVNTMLDRLRKNDSGAQMLFCPGPYWGDGASPYAHAYLQVLKQKMNAEVYVIWTGDAVVTPRITRSAAEKYKATVGHRLFLFDNYPVNDGQPTLHLGPVSGRAADLCEVVDGYMSNPMATQNQINRLPLATCADYAFNPTAYDPARSIGQSILLLASTPSQQQILKDLIETYPGFIATGGGTGSNPVRSTFGRLTTSEAKQQFRDRIDNLSRRFDGEFPGEFDAAKKTVAADVAWMKAQP